MRFNKRIGMLIALLLVAPVLAGCADVDLDKLDVFGLTEKKKLTGERKDVFPNGVPGVSQGIPPEYIKGNQPAAQDTDVLPKEPEKTAAVAPEPKPKPKPKRKPKPASQPAQITIPRAPQNAAQQPPPAAQPQTSQQASPWPAPPTQSQ